MINYFEIREDSVYINYHDEGIFNLLKALNIPFEADISHQCLTIPKPIIFENSDIVKLEKGHNCGGSTDYYKIGNYKDLQDIIENRNMNFAQGNILKAAFCFNVGRHEGTSYERELNKIIYFAERELKRIKEK